MQDAEQDKSESQKSVSKTRGSRLNRLRKWLWIALLLFLGAGTVCIALPFWLAGPSDELTPVAPSTISSPPESGTKALEPLTLITLNMAHGRLDQSMNPFVSREKAEANLQIIADTLAREKPDIVALQEADTNSFWNGSFDHVGFIAQKLGWTHFISGHQVQGLNLHYGTALMSRLPLVDGCSTTFSSALFSLPKGYVKATLTWPGDPEAKIEVISLHLDFMRASVRQRQIDELVQSLESSKNPFIVMGDFNCDWSGADSAVKRMAKALDLKAHNPDAANMITYPGLKKRLDWILISSCLQFESYEVLNDALSDRLTVKAVIIISPIN